MNATFSEYIQWFYIVGTKSSYKHINYCTSAKFHNEGRYWSVLVFQLTIVPKVKIIKKVYQSQGVNICIHICRLTKGDY